MTSDDLLAAGWTNKGVTPCGICKTPVVHFQSPSGTDCYINTDSHPNGPGILHKWTCDQDSGKMPAE